MVGVSAKPEAVGTSLFAEPKVTAVEAEDGAIYLRSPYPLGETSRCIGDWLVHWAQKRPDTVFIAERNSGNWRRLTYRQFHEQVRATAGWLLESGASKRHPVAILSENSVDHALLAHAAMIVGIPVATVSTAYCLMSRDHVKLKAMIELLDPRLVYVSDLKAYEGALEAIAGLHQARILASCIPARNPFNALPFQEAANPDNMGSVERAFSAVTPDTVARLLFTSGSTGTPKAVVNTHRMLVANQEANRIIWPFLENRHPVLVDWLPWSHTFGANFTSNLVLRNGGTLYIDQGKPAPPLIGHTIANIKEIRPTLHFNVPRGYDMLATALETDPEFRRTFFGADLIFYAAAALPKSVWDRLIALSNDTTGRTVPIVAAWGSTETAPLATSCYFQAEQTGNIGLPVPGTELKLVRNGDKLEVRVRGPNVTPGYYKQPEATRNAFDEEGFYKMGDAVRLVDPADPSKGLYFDGRVSEDFKLSSGTWVSAGDVRLSGIDALSPVAQDIVVAGHNHDEIGFLVFPNEAACRKLASAGQDIPLEQVLASPSVRNHIVRGLKSMRASGGGSSRYATRARLLLEPPDPDAGEITDKGYVNQRQVLANRSADVEKLQGDDPSGYLSINS